MAKQIYMTNDDVENIVEKVCTELRSNFSGLKCYGSIDIKRSFTFKSDDRIAMLYFTPIAWIKMTALVSRFETEVQWHGLVRRISENEFEVTDIIVPPHEVSGATVTSEYKPYIEWMDGLDDDTFNAVRFHGHSHVNMSVSPSPVDNKYRLDLVTQLPKPTGNDDVFYIFFIINKKHEWSAEIYDLTNNALYGTDDIDMECCLEDIDVDSFVADAKKVAITRTTYGGYGGANMAGHTAETPTVAVRMAAARMVVPKELPLLRSSLPAKARVKKTEKAAVITLAMIASKSITKPSTEKTGATMKP